MKTKKKSCAVLLAATASICFSQQITASKSDSQSISLGREGESLKCSTEFNFSSFTYSGDRQFLLFQHFDEKMKADLFLGFIELNTAYAQCSQKRKIKITHEPAGKNILDINKAGQIYLTYLQDMYRVGGNTMGVSTSIGVKRLGSFQEIPFPFTTKKHDSKISERRKIESIGGFSFFDPSNIPEYLRFISKDGKYISPLGTSCGVEDFQEVWSVKTRKKLSQKEIEDLIRKDIRCEDMFG